MVETTIWRGSSSQWINLGCFALAALFTGVFLYFNLYFARFLIPLCIILWYYLKVKTTIYEVTSERIIISKGIFSRTIDTLSSTGFEMQA